MNEVNLAGIQNASERVTDNGKQRRFWTAGCIDGRIKRQAFHNDGTKYVRKEDRNVSYSCKDVGAVFYEAFGGVERAVGGGDVKRSATIKVQTCSVDILSS